MTDDKGFWHTTTGMITAVAALITALAGLLGVLQSDLIGTPSDQRQAEAVTPISGGVDQISSEAPRNSPGASTVIPWAKATATLVRRDGSSASVKAPTVGLACDTEKLAFKNGQSVSLQLVRSIQFDAIYDENSSADGVVTLLDGRTLTDPIHTWNCPVMGSNELGRLEIKLEDIKRIDFER